MFMSNVYIKKIKSGNIIKNVREHYLRDDIGCGSELCSACNIDYCNLVAKPNNSNKLCKENHYFILDTNVILDQIDILDEDVINNVIILQTVYQEVKNRSLPVSRRLNSIIENSSRHYFVFPNEHHKDTYVTRDYSNSINDHNDMLIRRACIWYQNHIPDIKILLITDDVNNRKLAKTENISAYSMLEYVTNLNTALNLEDKLCKKDFHRNDEGINIFPKHLTAVEILQGVKSGKLTQGTFYASRENFLEGSVSIDGKDGTILLQGHESLNRAIDGDIVAVELYTEDKWSAPSDIVLEDEDLDGNDAEVVEKKEQVLKATASKCKKQSLKPTGRVVGIIRRKWRQYCGIIQQDGDSANVNQLFIPAEKKIPKIRIETRQTELLKTQKIIVTIDYWKRSSRYPSGHFVRALGKIGDRETENEVLLLEHNVPHSKFSEEVLSFLPKLPWVITEDDFKKRKDLRHLDICSVDPPGCTDIDDALHCRILPNRNYEVGVHIADVSHFIRPGTALDQEAASRATTVYLVDKRIDMVPELLSSNLCSLQGKQERFAFSVIWEMDENAKIINTTYHKSIIRSKEAFTYEQAQIKIDEKHKTDSLSISIRNLNKLAKILKRNRIENGALVLASPEIRFQIDNETMDPIDVQSKKMFETNSMVEEFMLLANISVAEKILLEFPDCALLRRHPEPPISNFDPLLKAGLHLGFNIDTSTGRKLALSLDKAKKNDNCYLNTMFRILATRCMLQAQYFSSGMFPKQEFPHYGLAVPLYTHFTSPIRRYADIIVHRLLAVCIGADVTYPDLLDKHKTENLCHNLNYRNRMAQYAGRASVAFNTHMFFREKVTDEDGYILYIRKNALQILIPKYGLECTLYLPKNNPDVIFQYNEENQTQQCGSVIFHAFDPVKIQLSLNSNNIQHEKMAVNLLEPYIENFSIQVTSNPAGEDNHAPEPERKKKNRNRSKKK